MLAWAAKVPSSNTTTWCSTNRAWSSLHHRLHPPCAQASIFRHASANSAEVSQCSELGSRSKERRHRIHHNAGVHGPTSKETRMGCKWDGKDGMKGTNGWNGHSTNPRRPATLDGPAAENPIPKCPSQYPPSTCLKMLTGRNPTVNRRGSLGPRTTLGG